MTVLRLLRKLGATTVPVEILEAVSPETSSADQGREERPVAVFSKTIAPAVSALAACVIASAAVVGVIVNYYSGEASRKQILGADGLSLAGQIKDLTMETRTSRSYMLDFLDLIARLHPDQMEEFQRVRRNLDEVLQRNSALGLAMPDATAIDYQLAGDPRELQRLYPALGPLDVSVARIAKVRGMLALQVPRSALGDRVPVYAMLDGRAIGVTPEGGTFRVELLHPSGYVTVYEMLSDVDVSVGKSLKRGEQIGMVRPASAACLRVGLRDPEGHFINPQRFMSAIVR